MASIISQLSSQKKERGGQSNKAVAKKCLKSPELLKEIAKHLQSEELRLSIDCAEVMTEVAKENPKLIAKYAQKLVALLKSKHTFARFEAMHALALVANLKPALIESLLPELEILISTEKSVIARDYAITAIAGYASTSKEAAQRAYPYLKKAIDQWADWHAHQAMRGLVHVIEYWPLLKKEIKSIAELFIDSPRGVVKKEAQRLLKLALS